MPVVSQILGWAFIAIGTLRLTWRVAPAAFRRIAPRRGSRVADGTSARIIEPGKWRNPWWDSGSVITGVAFVTHPGPLIRWLEIGVLIAILVITFPLWDPFSRGRHRVKG
jgi:hypothetical protein